MYSSKVDTIVLFHDLEEYKNINFSKYINIKCIIDPFKILKKNIKR